MNDNVLKALICVGGFLLAFLPLYLFADPVISPLYTGGARVSSWERQVAHRAEEKGRDKEAEELQNDATDNTEENATYDTPESTGGNMGNFVDGSDASNSESGLIGDNIDGVSEPENKEEHDDRIQNADVAEDQVEEYTPENGVGSIKNITPGNSNYANNISVQTFQYEEWGGITTVFLIKNESRDTVYTKINVTARDSNGTMIDSADDTALNMAPGASIPLAMNFKSADWSTTYEYTLNTGKATNENASASLNIETAKRDDGILVNVKNNGNKDTSICSIYVLFYENGKVVYCNYEFVGEMTGTIAPGASASREIGSGGRTFDDFTIYPCAEYASR